ncbi:hypothetical protein TIFTF001_041541 [Ficus carica]|uniref:RNase H type-1 domain-containing protein n=1 Tax=Ficus carica TaxID=3494 RepID=A0AA88D9K0_FICCA|nr:hypothetical protein TIFTF001_041541 [Ficus carica]
MVESGNFEYLPSLRAPNFSSFSSARSAAGSCLISVETHSPLADVEFFSEGPLHQSLNKLVFDGVMLQADAVVSWAGRLLGDYLTCNGPDKVAASKPKPVRLPWHAPWSGRVKINVDAAVWQSFDFIAIGVVVRDDKGTVIGALTRQIYGRFSPHLDAINVLRAVNESDSVASESNIIDDIREIVFEVGSENVCYAPCEGNDVAHFLTGLALSKVRYSS